MTDTVEPITREDRDLCDVLLHQPFGGFSQLDIGPYKIGIAITTEGGEQDPEKAGEALEEFVRRAKSSEERIKKLEEALGEIAKNDGWIGVPTETEAAVHLGLSLKEVVFRARQALEE